MTIEINDEYQIGLANEMVILLPSQLSDLDDVPLAMAVSLQELAWRILFTNTSGITSLGIYDNECRFCWSFEICQDKSGLDVFVDDLDHPRGRRRVGTCGNTGGSIDGISSDVLRLISEYQKAVLKSTLYRGRP
jgi:hypothetical protein